MKKITKIVLFLMMLFSAAGLPAMIAGAEKETQAVGGRTCTERILSLDLTADEIIYAGGEGEGNPARSNIVDSTEGWKWYLYGGTAKGYSPKTLVLEGINLSAAADKVLVVPDGTTIVLKGINTVASTYRGDLSCYGLYACGTLTVTGESDDYDTLAVTGGIPDSTYTVTSAGLYAGNFIMEGGCVTAVGGSAKFSRGLSVQTDLIMNGGSLHGLGGAASDGSAGLWMGGSDTSVTLSGGMLSVAGGPAAIGSSYGLYGSFCNISVTGGELTASGAAGSRGSFGVHILRRSLFSCTAGRMILWGDDMAANHIPLIDGDYQYKIGKEEASEPSGGWNEGRVSDFLSCKYVAVRLKEKNDEEIELG